jgi:hypothetical protein
VGVDQVVKFSNTRGLSESGSSFKPESLEEHKKNAALYRDCSTAILMPTRGMVHVKVMRSQLEALMHWPMNQKRCNYDAIGLEVGAAYQYLTETALSNPVSKNWHFIATWEDDNIVPYDGVHKLFDAIHTCIDCGSSINPESWTCAEGHRGIDGISGIYFAKVRPPIPMVFGDPKSEELEFRPRNVAEAIEKSEVIEVNGIPNGFAIFRADLFRQLPKPWWKTSSGTQDDPDGAFTQDLFFCKLAKEKLSARFAVHCGVRVGHIDTATGEIF